MKSLPSPRRRTGWFPPRCPYLSFSVRPPAATPEARVVKDADKLEMVHQALRYEATGVQTLDEFWSGHDWHYATSAQLFDALRSRRKLRTLSSAHA